MFNFLKKNGGGRVFVISIDGVPYDFMKSHMEKGDFPNFKKLVATARFAG